MEATLNRTVQRVHESDDEKLLIEQAQSGDREAFEELVRRHDRDILRLAFHMLGNREEAREVFQETFLKAYRSLARFLANLVVNLPGFVISSFGCRLFIVSDALLFLFPAFIH